VHAGNGKRIAIIWDSPVTGREEMFTYERLLAEVETLAGVLKEEGVQKGHVVLIYMPMIPAALIAMLAINRLGAVHAVVFGGLSPPSLAQRIEASRPKAIMTASCGIEGSKKPIAYQSLIRSAIEKSKFKPQKTIIWQRAELRWDRVNKSEGERNWQRLIKSARNRGLKTGCVPVKSSDGVYIIYTSGKNYLRPVYNIRTKEFISDIVCLESSRFKPALFRFILRVLYAASIVVDSARGCDISPGWV
jgi:propionyl-CoA synthetase